MSEPLRAVLYARVSTEEQNTDAQFARLRRLAKAREWSVVAELADVGYSGRRGVKRPSWERVKTMARMGDVDVVAAVRMSRLSRSLQDLLGIAESFERWRVALVADDMEADTTTPSGRLWFHMFAALCQFERELIAERTRISLTEARARGVRLGRPPKSTPSRIHELRERGMTIEAIAAEVGIHRSTVVRRLSEYRRGQLELAADEESDLGVG